MNPFRLGLVTGDLFCNRTAEIELLCSNMRNGTHTVMYAPRRYGKSSLAKVVMERLREEMTCVYTDLFPVTSSEEVAEMIYRSIVAAIGSRAADRSTVAARLAAFFRSLRLSLEFDPASNLPEFSVSLGDVPVEVHLESIITSLDAYCAENGIRVCLVLDEFQEICNLKDSKKVEALLRGGMQAASHVSFMIMGSRRTILRDMFEDRKRPFYKSASVLQLPRMGDEVFARYLVERFAAGGQELDLAGAAQMVAFCDAYPYYVQKLALLSFNAKVAGLPLESAERELVLMESADFENIFINLTNHQKKLLKAVARCRPANIYGHAFLSVNRLGSQGGVQSSLVKLKKLDLVEQRQEGWYVVDPVFEKWLQ